MNRHTVMLSDFQKSYVMKLPTGTGRVAVVFVHGYGGTPTSTWQCFQPLLSYSNSGFWGAADAFFYSYRSWQIPMVANAQRLQAFLDAHVLSVPTYKDLVFVGHSEGAVLLRKIVIDRIKELHKKSIDPVTSGDLISMARLRLFAPACLGTNFSSLLGFIFTWSGFVAALAATSVVRNELRPESPVLSHLREETNRAIQNSPVPALLAKNLFGERDQVVYADCYPNDEIEFLEGHDHFSVCKPTEKFVIPLQFVERL